MSDLKKELKILERRVAEIKKAIEREANWPQDDDLCWVISSSGCIISTQWNGIDHATNVVRKSVGNLFKSAESAQLRCNQLMINEELRELANKAWRSEGRDIDWKNEGQPKFCIYFNNYTDKFEFGMSPRYQHSDQVYFPSLQSVELALLTIGKEQLKILFKEAY